MQRLLVGRILARFEERGLKLVGLKLMHADRALAERHYAVHRDKPFFEGLLDFITSGPLVALALDGPNAIAVVRSMVGATRPHEATAGTIRGDLAVETAQNLVHASDGAETAAAELALWFEPGSCSSTAARSIAGCSRPGTDRPARSPAQPPAPPIAVTSAIAASARTPTAMSGARFARSSTGTARDLHRPPVRERCHPTNRPPDPRSSAAAPRPGADRDGNRRDARERDPAEVDRGHRRDDDRAACRRSRPARR